MKKILVVGCGISGKAVIEFGLRRGWNIVAVDRSTNQRVGCPVFHEEHLFEPFDFDQVVVSPGVKLNHFQIEAANRHGVEVIGEAELGLRQVDNLAIGLTGTNGKSTTVSMIAHILNLAGKKAHLVGNIGLPVIAVVDTLEKDDILVIELSSFQLMTMSKRSLDIAIILNITPNHLDWHASFEEYKEAKLSIKNLLKPGGLFLYPIANLDAVKQVCFKLGVNEEIFKRGLETFKKLDHRQQFVGEVNGVRCVDDSKATTPTAVIHAIESIPGPIVLICGGINKGVSMQPIRELVEKRCRAVILIGQSKYLIANELGDSIVKIFADTMQEAIQKGLQHALQGDTLLLAPGCSSFDMFENYKARGEAFKKGIIDESERHRTSCSLC